MFIVILITQTINRFTFIFIWIVPYLIFSFILYFIDEYLIYYWHIIAPLSINILFIHIIDTYITNVNIFPLYRY